MRLILTLIPLASLICYIGLIIFILKNKKSRVINIYLVSLFVMAIWSYGSFAMRIKLSPSPLFWNNFYCYAMISYLFVYYHFILTLTEKSYLKVYVRVVPAYIVNFILLVVNFKGLVVTKVLIGSNGNMIYRLGIGAIWCGIASFIIGCLCLFRLNSHFKKYPAQSKTFSFIASGLSIMLLGSLLNLIPEIGKYPIDFIASTLNAFFIAYAIYRYKFLEISIKTRKGIIYFIIASIVSLVISISFNMLYSKYGYYANVILFGTLILLMSPLFFKTYNRILDKVASGRIYYIQDMIKKYLNEINNLIDRKIIAKKLLTLLTTGFMLKRSYIFLFNEQENVYDNICSLKDNKPFPILQSKINFNSIIIRIIKKFKNVLTVDEFCEIARADQDEYTIEFIKNYFVENEVELIVPINRYNKLFGFILLSDKVSADPYTKDDLTLIKEIVRMSTPNFDNSYMYQKLKDEAIKDDLTGLFNQRYLINYLDTYFKKYPNTMISLSFFNIDHFKILNDIHGYKVGDRIIKQLSKELKQMLPINFIICRMYSDVFGIAMPGCSSSEAYEIMEEFRKKICNNVALNIPLSDTFTISCGIATYPQDSSNKNKLFEHAQKSVDIAKKMGRNRTIYYSLFTKKTNLIKKIQARSKNTTMEAIFSLVEAINQRDSYTREHSEKVADYVAELARYIGMSEEKIDNIRLAGLLHDVGKIGIPESILNKEDKLTDQEYTHMKLHVDKAIEILKHIPALHWALPAISGHHERYDGKGYPRRLKGEEIPYEARMLAICDTFDAMTTDRPYRKGMDPKNAIEEIKRCVGQQFDPDIAKVFIEMYESKNEVFESGAKKVIEFKDIKKYANK